MKNSPAFLVFENYEKILKWNRSLRFGVTVCTLANMIKMKFNLSYIYIFVFLFSCTQDMKIMKKPLKIQEPTYSSKGFALIYDNSIFESKIVNKKLNNVKIMFCILF